MKKLVKKMKLVEQGLSEGPQGKVDKKAEWTGPIGSILILY